MNPAVLLVSAIFLPILFGLAGMLLPRRLILSRVLLSAMGPAGALVLLSIYAWQSGLEAGRVGCQWMPALQLDLFLHADKLGLFFAFLVAGMGLAIVLYARGYFGHDPDSLYRFYPSLLLFMTAMLGLVLADNFMLLLLFWEMTSISSFLLIGWEREDRDAVKSAMQAFIVTGVGGLVLMGGLILLGVVTGQWSFSGLQAMSDRLPHGTLLTAAFLLIFAGAAAKSAQWPLHFWLPGAMAAPTPVSAYLHSATMVKAGVYLIGRLSGTLADMAHLWPQVIVTFGAITMVLGAYVAIRKSDLKQIFAYSTVSQLGLLMCMYGLSAFTYAGESNRIWDITQILNHAIYKAPLFLIAGAIGHVTGTRELPDLRGLFRVSRTAKVLAIILLLAAYAMAAGPFTVSFTAKELFFYQVHHAHAATGHPVFYALIGAGIVTGMFNVAIFIRLARALVGGHPEPHLFPGGAGHHDIHGEHDYEGAVGHAHAELTHEIGFWPAMLWLPALLIVSLQFIGGIIPGAYEGLFGAIERSRTTYFDHFPLTWHAHAGTPLYMSIAAVALGVILGFLPIFRRVIRDIHDQIYPGFYTLVTKGGGRLFGLLQNGNVRFYIAIVAGSAVALGLWGASFKPTLEPAAFHLEPFRELMPGYLLTMLVCLAAILMPLVKEDASRVLVLGTLGFSVTAVYYLYGAPDLALTQISIEIVSVILFLLVLSLLPKGMPTPRVARLPRLALSLAFGGLLMWLTLSAATGALRPMDHRSAEGRSYANLGEFFLRNAEKGIDTAAVQREQLTQGVRPRGVNADGTVQLHSGGGGNNVVNVILVDFRGNDSLGEITVLAIAALGVWTLLRQRALGQQTAALRRNLSDPRTSAVSTEGNGQPISKGSHP